ncbi:MAG TPA: hypothetical protein VGS41_03490, partial [Chthonomonadales bacterium]|nr:hypothetical protein [Chthonomonadales bacterium]
MLLPHLEYPPDDLIAGCSLGNRDCFVRSTPRANLDNLWISATGEWRFGEAALEFLVEGAPPCHKETLFEPGAMRADYAAGDIILSQCLFVQAETVARVYLMVEIRNAGRSPAKLVIRAHGCFAARPSLLHRRQPPQEDIELRVKPISSTRNAALIVETEKGDRLEVRSGSGAPPQMSGPQEWFAEEKLVVSPQGQCNVWWALTAGSGTRAPAPAHTAYLKTLRSETRLCEGVCSVGAPSPVINGGVGWGKVNTDRVFHLYRNGYGFTNDPPGSIVVTRDAAWWVFGADYYRPDCCRKLLDTITQHAPYPEGKIAEYIDLAAQPVSRADYNLNIADPTPLYLLAVRHHAACTGDSEWLRKTLPTAVAAADYLLSQVIDGLVVCQ